MIGAIPDSIFGLLEALVTSSRRLGCPRFWITYRKPRLWDHCSLGDSVFSAGNRQTPKAHGLLIKSTIRMAVAEIDVSYIAANDVKLESDQPLVPASC